MWMADRWQDYAVLDTGEGEKLERWGRYTLRRPDPQVIWPKEKPELWDMADAHYHRSKDGGGNWDIRGDLPSSWRIGYGDLRFLVRPTGFKHTGLFPEQAVNWDWMGGLIRGAGRPVEVLNLFAYTGGATAACAAAGAKVCHVDAAKGMVSWARENLALSGLADAPVRFLVDDAMKFAQREARRGRTYDGILMDPPSYGRGPDGQVWKLEETLYPLVEACAQILSGKPLFFLINSYTTGLSPSVLSNLLMKTAGARFGGTADAREIALPIENGGLVLPCGSSGRWTA